jgi:low affinity Fe/Cu permease
LGVDGAAFRFSDTWQLVINTGTTIVTFLMVFLIQNTQNRDARAINLKLNELIHAIDKARNQMIDIETLSDLELDQLKARYEAIRSKCVEPKEHGDVYVQRKTEQLFRRPSLVLKHRSIEPKPMPALIRIRPRPATAHAAYFSPNCRHR